jgi:hypothetical protein
MRAIFATAVPMRVTEQMLQALVPGIRNERNDDGEIFEALCLCDRSSFERIRPSRSERVEGFRE